MTESIDDRPEHAELRRQVARFFEREVEPKAATWDDGVIDPLDTRMTLALGLSAALNAPIPQTRFGVFRM